MVESISWSNVKGHTVIPGFVGRFVHSERMTLVRWQVQAGAKLPEHSHPHEQIVLIDRGELELTVSGTTVRLKQGDMIVIPSNAVHSGTALTEVETTDVFCPVREDYRGSF